MFVDYYKVLNINKGATSKEIKAGFRNEAKKWHPDKNPNIDVNEQMQLINEAYLILKDSEARERYDIEYYNFYEYLSAYQSKKQYKYKEEYNDYEYKDELLYKWILNAKKQAVELAKETIKEMKELSVSATVAAGNKIIELLISFFLISIIGIIILFIVKIFN